VQHLLKLIPPFITLLALTYGTHRRGEGEKAQLPLAMKCATAVPRIEVQSALWHLLQAGATGLTRLLTHKLAISVQGKHLAD
jgi:hypothetical protein